MVCHTFGLPVDVSKIREITENKLLIIEDCAHSFGAKVDGSINSPQAGNYTGNLGDVSFFSLYKQFPILRGGMIVSSRDWDVSLSKTYFGFRDFLSLLNYFSFFAFFFKRFGSEIASKIERKEKLLKPTGLNQISLNLFSRFFQEFEESLESRKKMALLFQEELKKLDFEVQEPEGNVFCYLSALTPKNLEEKRDELVNRLKKRKIFCTRIWHDNPPHPAIIFNPKVQEEYQINLNEFPNTLEAAKRIINFPLQNHYTKKDIEKMVSVIKTVLKEI